ncbi:MAG: hypothetical protein WCL02_02370 [bacterium]
MKKLIMIIIITVMSMSMYAQQLDMGMSFIPIASTVNFDMKNMVVSNLLLAQVNYNTAKTYHVLAYNFNGTSLMTFQGWMYKPNQDAYVVIGKNLKNKEGYLAIGWEHTILNGSFAPSAFIEIGTNYAFSENYFSIGIFAPLNWTVWKKNK